MAFAAAAAEAETAACTPESDISSGSCRESFWISSMMKTYSSRSLVFMAAKEEKRKVKEVSKRRAEEGDGRRRLTFVGKRLLDLLLRLLGL